MNATNLPDWIPSEYDPDAPLLDRLRIMADIEGGIELHAQGDNGVVEILGEPQHYNENPRRFHLACGSKPDDWSWEITVSKKVGAPASLDSVNPNQDVEAYEDTKRHWFQIEDVRMYGVDVDRLND